MPHHQFVAFRFWSPRILLVTRLHNFPWVLLVQLMMQLVNLGPGLYQRFSARRRDLVYPASSPCEVFQFRLQQTAALHSVKERIERAWPNAITMMFKFLHHGEAKDRFLRGMNEHMDADKSGEKVPLLC